MKDRILTEEHKKKLRMIHKGKKKSAQHIKDASVHYKRIQRRSGRRPDHFNLNFP